MCRRRCYRRTGRRYHKLLPPCLNRCRFTPRQFAKPCFCRRLYSACHCTLVRRTAYCRRFACVACQSGTAGGGQRHSAGKGRRTDLISGGAAAGLAAVFNAPLAGVIFVLEEINHNFSGFLLFPVLSASVAATFTSRLILGRDTVFNFSGLPVLQYSDYWVILAAGIICGVLGALFNYGLLNAKTFCCLPLLPLPAYICRKHWAAETICLPIPLLTPTP